MATLVLALVAALSLFLIRQRSAPTGKPTGQAGEKTTAHEAAATPIIERLSDSETKSNSQAAALAGQPDGPDNPAAGSAEARQEAYVAEKVAQLGDLAMENDSASLDTILAELTNRDSEIRKAALEAAIQFGSRDAIPKLADVALQTDDAQEKAAIAEAIEFLKLPSPSEAEAQTGGPTKPARSKVSLQKPAKQAPSASAP
ncbi:MAG TPA: HEAT repeat domain-containing protein [Pyrinomonadaceae bacterium]|nr:HEAT repeat domain-containing protein [Pyrinomonadaceae bacterium]